jgi:hypothetical protein
MKMFTIAGFLAALTVTAAQAMPGNSAPICIRPFDAPTGGGYHTHVVDARTIVFYMRDGKVWQNTLREPCPGLALHGFRFVTHQDEVCSNAQTITVLESGAVCQLGEFTAYTPPPAAH